MPELAEHEGALVVDGGHDGLPGFHVLGCVDARGAGVAMPALIDDGAFADHEPARGSALGVVLGHHGLGNGAKGAASGQWSVHDAVLELQRAQLVGLEEGVVGGSGAIAAGREEGVKELRGVEGRARGSKGVLMSRREVQRSQQLDKI